MEKKKDIRLNKDYRNAYQKDFRRFLESKSDNPKYEAFLSAKTLCKTRISEAHKTAKEVAEFANDVEEIPLIKMMSDIRIIINEADSVYIYIKYDANIYRVSIHYYYSGITYLFNN